ncbi:inorganic phosphate transporter [Arenibacter sp. BSSL-BM3]|uniref:Phosphate transporter n=1 Tax=Arenibacter arenosicollis TaxID=2762274 RepID=A0ABR7QJU4_9FLAO|nr:inorganic phosphate transporter [Arenibacter arenosicollis]MBC8767453.1 inorganic phosphate transporter [Arenibacter arenosicollis]
MIFVLLFVVVCFLAYSNGANDNFKGVATLFGSGTTNYSRAINWATLTTFLGSVTAIFLASSLVKNFSGKGLVPDALIQTPEFAVSIALGAGITVFLATKIGMPISTTHSLVGGLFGSGIVAVGSAFNFSLLGSTFIMPLILSPLMATVASMVAYLLFRRLRVFFGVNKQMCICIGQEYVPIVNNLNKVNPVADSITSYKSINIDKEQNCIERYQGAFLGLNAQKLLDVAHFLSAGVVSFARGLNDTPKLVGLLIVINSLSIEWGMVALAFAMAIGGLLNAKKVGETVSKKITPMNHGQGFTANLITGLLVTTASIHGLPVSTTHVSVGSIFGIGSVTKKSDIKVIRNIVLSWILTLPIAALISAIVFSLLSYVF